MEEIRLRNIYLHNLKHIDLSVPKEKFVVLTGVSGSGKSTVAFDVLYEEGRRHFLQAAGRIPDLSDEKKFDSIEGLGPVIAVGQRIGKDNNVRSVVGTRTGILDLLRNLFSVDGEYLCQGCGTRFSGNENCPNCGQVIIKMEPYFFSFNTKMGMCLECFGRGMLSDICEELLVKNDEFTISQICKDLKVTSSRILDNLDAFAEYFHIAEAEPFRNLDKRVQEAFLQGYRTREFKFWGVIPYLKWKDSKGRLPKEYKRKKICPKCNGYRLGEEALDVLIDGRNIGELSAMTLQELQDFLAALPLKRSLSLRGEQIIRLIKDKIEQLKQVKLSYLSLDRELPSLSGGEQQRLYMMSILEAEMEGITFIFDEPTQGLHRKEKDVLLDKIEEIKEMDNSVVVVEHDKGTIERAEHIIEFGPLAGVKGGEVVYQGEYQGLLEAKDSITGAYLSKRSAFTRKKKIVSDIDRKYIEMKHVCTNNLKDITVKIPLGVMIGIAGFSGSGKSSLIHGTLVPILRQYRKASNSADIAGKENDSFSFLKYGAREVTGLEYVDGFEEVEQGAIGRNSRSIVATYLGIWDNIRKLFSRQAQAKDRKITPKHFSFNSSGACKHCHGSGMEEEDCGDLGKFSCQCSECKGKRYQPEVLEITYKGKTITDVLEMDLAEAADFFEKDSGILNILCFMCEIGMDYVKLGQPVPSLSGGEAQRIKLVKSLVEEKDRKKLFILDEPTTGLSSYDVNKLFIQLEKMIEAGNSILIIEHDTEVLSQCDWIIELGPEGGEEGGKVIAQGTPEDLRKHKASIIGPYL